jgi:hypothetical protein
MTEEVFKSRVVESPVTQETATQDTIANKSDEHIGNGTKAEDGLTVEEHNLDIWEGLKRTKYVNEYFGTKQFEGEFNIKMQTSAIDKFIKSELQEKGYEQNTDNWEKVLNEIENEIGSNNLELFKRLDKLVGYINVLNKIKKVNVLKKKYLTLQDS